MPDASEAASQTLLSSCSSECRHVASSRNAQSEKYHFQSRSPATANRKLTTASPQRIDTPQEAQYYADGGILQFVLRQLLTGKIKPQGVHA